MLFLLPDGKSASRNKHTYYKLDTPCAAGARSTSFHPAATTSRQLLSQRQKTSVRAKLAKRYRIRTDLEEQRFVSLCVKNTNLMVEKGSLNRPAPLVKNINCDPLSDHPKSKAQTTKVQQPCHTLQMPPAEINYLAKEEENISF